MSSRFLSCACNRKLGDVHISAQPSIARKEEVIRQDVGDGKELTGDPRTPADCNLPLLYVYHSASTLPCYVLAQSSRWPILALDLLFMAFVSFVCSCILIFLPTIPRSYNGSTPRRCGSTKRTR